MRAIDSIALVLCKLLFYLSFEEGGGAFSGVFVSVRLRSNEEMWGNVA